MSARRPTANRARIWNPQGRKRAMPAGDHRTLRTLLAAHAAGDESATRAIETMESVMKASSRQTNDNFERRYVRALLAAGRTPFPAAPEHVAAFLGAMVGKRSWKTILQYGRVVARGHVLRGHDDPMRHDLVVRVLEAARRTPGGLEHKIRPLLVEDYLAVRAVIPRDLRGSRDRLVLGLGFEGLLWPAEMVGLDVDDVEETDEGLLVSVRTGDHPRRVAINRRGSDDVTEDFATWLLLSGLETGPLLRSVDRHGGIAPRTDVKTLRHIVKTHVERAGLDPSHYGLHSLRTGYLASGTAAGVSALQLAQKAGFRRTVPLAKYRNYVPRRHADVTKLVT